MTTPCVLHGCARLTFAAARWHAVCALKQNHHLVLYLFYGQHVLWLSRSLREKGLGGNVFFGKFVQRQCFLLGFCAHASVLGVSCTRGDVTPSICLLRQREIYRAPACVCPPPDV